MLRPSARCSVPDSSRRRRAVSSRGSSARLQPAGEVGRGRVRQGIGRHVGQSRQVVHLVEHQQGAVAPELRQVQVGGSSDGLVGGDIALQATGRVGGIIGGAHGDGVAERAAPGRVSERFLGLLAQAVARHHPAHALDDAGRQQGRGRRSPAVAICRRRG